MTTFSSRRTACAVLLTGFSLALTACGSGSSTDDGGSTAGAKDAQGFDVAYLSVSSANTFLQPARKAMDEVAKKADVTITEFDAQFKPGEQAKQINDIIAAGKYEGIVIASVDGAAIIPDLEAAIASGIQVAVLSQVIGTSFETADPQFEGVAVSVLTPPLGSGKRLGMLTAEACQGVTPCRVVYFYGIKGIPLDTAVRKGFDSEVAKNPNIKVVAEGEGKYLGPDEAFKSLQDIQQSTPDFDVVVGADQSMQGAALALKDAGKTKVKLVGAGGSQEALDGIKSGSWFGTVFLAPATEGRLAMEGLVKAMKEGTLTGGVDPSSTLRDNGLVTQQNVNEFEAEWAG
jgi:ribose transport system substrate-binding protein